MFPDTSRGPSARKLAQADRVAILQRVPLFASVPKRHIKQIARLTRLEQFEPDQDLITQGQPSKAAFILTAGKAGVHRRGHRTVEVGPGDIVGELGLLLDRPRLATVRSLTPIECLALDRNGLKSCVTDLPGLGWYLLQTVAERLSN